MPPDNSPNDQSTDLILRAVAFAAHKHRDQRRKDKDASPYINHPIALATVLWGEGGVHATARAKLVKLADKICNLRDMAAHPPHGWSLERRRKYFDWASEVIGQLRGVHPELERRFDEVSALRP